MSKKDRWTKAHLWRGPNLFFWAFLQANYNKKEHRARVFHAPKKNVKGPNLLSWCLSGMDHVYNQDKGFTNYKYNENLNKQFKVFLKRYKFVKLENNYSEFNKQLINKPLNLFKQKAPLKINKGPKGMGQYKNIQNNRYQKNKYNLNNNLLDIKQKNRSYSFLQTFLVKYLQITNMLIPESQGNSTKIPYINKKKPILTLIPNKRKELNHLKKGLLLLNKKPIKIRQNNTKLWNNSNKLFTHLTFFNQIKQLGPSLFNFEDIFILRQQAKPAPFYYNRVKSTLNYESQILYNTWHKSFPFSTKTNVKTPLNLYFLFNKINNKSFLSYWLLPFVGIAIFTPYNNMSNNNLLSFYDAQKGQLTNLCPAFFSFDPISYFGSMGFSPSMAKPWSTRTMPPRGIDAFQASRYSILGGSLDAAQAGGSNSFIKAQGQFIAKSWPNKNDWELNKLFPIIKTKEAFWPALLKEELFCCEVYKYTKIPLFNDLGDINDKGPGFLKEVALLSKKANSNFWGPYLLPAHAVYKNQSLDQDNKYVGPIKRMDFFSFTGIFKRIPQKIVNKTTKKVNNLYFNNNTLNYTYPLNHQIFINNNINFLTTKNTLKLFFKKILKSTEKDSKINCLIFQKEKLKSLEMLQTGPAYALYKNQDLGLIKSRNYSTNPLESYKTGLNLMHLTKLKILNRPIYLVKNNFVNSNSLQNKNLFLLNYVLLNNSYYKITKGKVLDSIQLKRGAFVQSKDNNYNNIKLKLLKIKNNLEALLLCRPQYNNWTPKNIYPTSIKSYTLNFEGIVRLNLFFKKINKQFKKILFYNYSSPPNLLIGAFNSPKNRNNFDVNFFPAHAVSKYQSLDNNLINGFVNAASRALPAASTIPASAGIVFKRNHRFLTHLNQPSKIKKEPLLEALQQALKNKKGMVYSIKSLLKQKRFFILKKGNEKTKETNPAYAVYKYPNKIQTRLELQKKRRAKKQRLETRRQKKRTRLFPRSVWLRYRMFLNFLNKRIPLEWLQAGPCPNSCFGLLNTAKAGHLQRQPSSLFLSLGQVKKLTTINKRLPNKRNLVLYTKKKSTNQKNNVFLRRIENSLFNKKRLKQPLKKITNQNNKNQRKNLLIKKYQTNTFLINKKVYNQFNFKVHKNFVTFKNQKTNNPPPLSDKDKDKDTVFRDFWIWAYNNPLPFSYKKTIQDPFSFSLLGPYSLFGAESLSPIRSNNNLSFFKAITNKYLINWALNKTNNSSFTDYNKRYNLWNTQKLRNQSKNNKTKNIEKQFNTFQTNNNLRLILLNNKIVNNNLTTFYKKLLNKYNQKTQKLNYLSSLKNYIFAAKPSRINTRFVEDKFISLLFFWPWAFSPSMPFGQLSNSCFGASPKAYLLAQHINIQNNNKGPNKFSRSVDAKGRNTNFTNLFYFKQEKKRISQSIAINWLSNLLDPPACAASKDPKQLFDNETKTANLFAQKKLLKTKNLKMFNTSWWDTKIPPIKSRATSPKATSKQHFFMDVKVYFSLILKKSKQKNLFIISSFLLHLCALISLVSISQVRCFIKFHVILLYKLSNFYTALIDKLVNNLPIKTKGLLLLNKNSLRANKYQQKKNIYKDSNKTKGYKKHKSAGFALQLNQKNSFFSGLTKNQKSVHWMKPYQTKLLTYFSFNLLNKEFINMVKTKDKPSSTIIPFLDIYIQRKQALLAASKKPALKNKKEVFHPYNGYWRYYKYNNINIMFNIINMKASFFKLDNFRYKFNLFSKNTHFYKLEKTKYYVKKTLYTIIKQTKNKVLQQVFNLINLFQTSIRNVSNFFEKPAEYTTSWIAFGFLVEWSSDLITIIPENIDIYIWNVFSKISRITLFNFYLANMYSSALFHLNGNFNKILPWFGNNTSGPVSNHYSFFGNLNYTMINSFPCYFFGYALRACYNLVTTLTISHLLHGRMLYLFDTLIFTISQPDADLISRQAKGTLFWDIWADFLVTAADYYNVNVAALSTIKAEQNTLIDNISNDNTQQIKIAGPKKDLLSKNLLNLHINSQKTNVFFTFIKSESKNKEKVTFNPKKNLRTKSSIYESIARSRRPDFILKSVQTDKKNWGLDFLAVPGLKFKKATKKLKKFTANYLFSDRWAVNQYVTYQSWHSHNGSNNSNGDLFIDYHPPKSFSHIPGIKYNNIVQQPLGNLVCSIYSGMFNKQISKNILLVNTSTLEEHRGAQLNTLGPWNHALSSNQIINRAPKKVYNLPFPDVQSLDIKSKNTILSAEQTTNNKIKKSLGSSTPTMPPRGIDAFQASRYSIHGGSSSFIMSQAGNPQNNIDYNVLLIQALAGETELKIVTDNAQRYAFVNRGFAIGIKLLRDVFDAIALNTPCIFLLEDIHAIGERRPMLISDFGGAVSDDNNSFKEDFFGSQRDEVHEKNQVVYQLTRHKIAHYKKPFKGDYSLAIPTNLYVTDLFLKQPTPSTSNYSLIANHNYTLKNKIKIKTSNEKSLKNKTQTSGSLEGSNINHTFKGYSFFRPLKNTSNQKDKTSPFSVLLLKEEKRLKPNQIVEELPWAGLQVDFKGDLLATKLRTTYSVRAKVSQLAELSFSNISAKLDMITDLLVIIDSVRSNKGFVVFATTDVPHILDPALRRPGRLDETICLPNFNNNTLLQFNTNYETLKSIKFFTTIPKKSISQLTLKTGVIKKQSIGLFKRTNQVTINLKDYDTILTNHQNHNLNYAKLSHSDNLVKKFKTKNTKTSLLAKRYPQSNLLKGVRHQKQVTKKALAYYETGKILLNFYLNKQYNERRFLNKADNYILTKKSINYLSLYGTKNKLILQLMYLFGGKISLNLFLQKLNMPLDKKSDAFVEAASRATDWATTTNRPKTLNTNKFSWVSPTTYLLEENENIQTITAIMLSFIQKQDLYGQNLIVPKLLSFTDGNILDEPPSPPFSSLLIPAKRFENYKRVFKDLIFGDKMGQRKTQISLVEKIRYHMQLNKIKNLNLTLQTDKNNITLESKSKQSIDGLKPTKTTFFYSSEAMDYPASSISLNSSNRLTDKTALESIASENTTIHVTNINWYYQNRILKRHGQYLTNQWWNGQLSEHNAETVFLSDIDWRSSFIKNKHKTKTSNGIKLSDVSISNSSKEKRLFKKANNLSQNKKDLFDLNGFDVLLDFPDTDQYYNPKRRRWLLNKGYWSFWFNFDKVYSEKIIYTWILESITHTYAYLHNNLELLDFLTSKFMPCIIYYPDSSNIKKLILTNSFKRF